MATLSLIVLTSKRSRNNTDIIRVAVAHNGQTRYLTTNISVFAGEFKNGKVVNRADANIKNLALSKIMQEYERKLLDLDYICGLSCPELVTLLSDDMDNPTTIGATFDEYVFTARVKETTKTLMRSCVKSLFDHLGYNFPLKKLNYARVMRYEQYIRSLGNNDGTVRTKMAIFAKIIKYALKSGYVKYEIPPFAHYKYPIEPVRDSWLTLDQIRLLRDYNFSRVGRVGVFGLVGRGGVWGMGICFF